MKTAPEIAGDGTGLREKTARMIDPLAWEVSESEVTMRPKGMDLDAARDRVLAMKATRRARAMEAADAVLSAVEGDIRRKALEEAMEIADAYRRVNEELAKGSSDPNRILFGADSCANVRNDIANLIQEPKT